MPSILPPVKLSLQQRKLLKSSLIFTAKTTSLYHRIAASRPQNGGVTTRQLGLLLFLGLLLGLFLFLSLNTFLREL
jgi:hypothetical protein